MAPETRNRSIDDRLENTQAEVDILKEQMNKRFQELACKLDAIFYNYREQPPPHGSATTSHSACSRDHAAARNLRLKVSRYDGLSDPQGWIYKINQFFDFYDMAEDQRLKIAPFYFEGKALAWFQWVHKNTVIDSWSGFSKALQSRFGPSEMEDYQGKLTKLIQLGTVMEYQEQFETISNQVDGLSESFLVSCFISGLKPEILHDVSSFRPTSLTHAMSLAKIQESKIQLKNNPPKLHSSYPPLLPTPLHPSKTTQNTNPTKTAYPVNTTNTLKPDWKRLTQSQIQERRDKNLCFTCGDKYFFGHKCKASVHVLIVPDEEEVEEFHSLVDSSLSPPGNDVDESITTIPQISFHALAGVIVPQTLRFTSYIGKSEFSLLVDGGSTHNFIQPKLVSSLSLPVTNDKQFEVMVGNGQTLHCQGFCPAVPVQIQHHIFLVDFYILPVQGADMVLGVQWLQVLGPVTLDYNKLTMEFQWHKETIKLKGESHTGPISLNQFRKIQQTGQVESLFHLKMLDTIFDSPTEIAIPQVQQLLVEFDALFHEPTDLPPHRQIDHEIHLEPNTLPVNVRPYRYPHFQKNEIEKQVAQMLDSGFIKHSNSPFSSPVLLVKKKDGT
ncbi:uncharacterized protein LOC133293925 [Gastrolobium bilobum]|uniref:uncharacterized protein LOC133293925 n=1 Tax=Gastrolobium bilobum TaxID=150636 RepID=UPI002AB1301D|nr:uncharacterized protein LOC133293925 [Gastrolobium bilobum]